MSATFTWKIDWMKASTQTINGFSEVVLECGWRCTGTETVNGTTYTNDIYNTCTFPEPAEGASFTPANELSTAQVIGWCWSNGVNQEATEASINAKLTAQANPATVLLPPPAA